MTRGKTQDERHLDDEERELVRLSRVPAMLDDDDIRSLLQRLRRRRDRVQRMIRARTRDGATGADTGARDKKAVLVDALTRVREDWKARRSDVLAREAAGNLREAVARRAEAPKWRGPESRTAHEGMNSLPNGKIAPSGALHAEGMRAAISRSTGDR